MASKHFEMRYSDSEVTASTPIRTAIE